MVTNKRKLSEDQRRKGNEGGGGHLALFILILLILNSLLQEADKGWRIITETTIKAKSIKGFNTSASKRIENKFFLGEASHELLDDWDSRKVESVLELHESSSNEKNCCEYTFQSENAAVINVTHQVQQIVPHLVFTEVWCLLRLLM